MKIATVLIGCAAASVWTAQAKVERYWTKDKIPRYYNAEKEIWTNAVNEVASWKKVCGENSIAVIQHGSAFTGQTVENSDAFTAYGLEIDIPESETWIGWWQIGNPISIGAGGVDVKKGRFFIGYKNASDVILTADQVWTGSGNGGKMYFSLGTVYERYFARATANAGVTSFGIAGGLNACFFAPDNDFKNVTVTVRDQAKLWLFDVVDARLNAKKLIFSGDGNRMEFGTPLPDTVFHYPVDSAVAPTNIVAIDHAHLAPQVELNDGADLTAVDGIYALTNLTVSGNGSEITGSLDFTQAVSRITFAVEGSSLTFKTKNTVANDMAAGFAVSGPGTLTVEDMTPFAGTVMIGDGAVFACTLGVGSAVPTFTGAGTLAVHAQENGFVYLSSAALAGFSGKIVFDTGTLVLDEPLADGRLTVESGTVVYGSESALIVTDMPVTESLTIAPGQTLSVYGNGLAAETTLTLAGGTVRFMRTATIAAPVTISAAGSVVETAAENVVGTFSGKVTSSISGTGNTGTSLAGEGCIRFTGGGDFTGQGNSLRSYNGSAVFDGGTYLFHNCGAIGLFDLNDTSPSEYGRRWRVVNGAVLKLSADSLVSGTRVDLEVAGDGQTWEYSRDSVLEVQDGGTVEIGENTYLKIGKYFSKGTLRIASGGVVKQTASSGHILLGYSTMGWGEVCLEDGGDLELVNPLCVRYDNVGYVKGSFHWSGGTVKVLGGFPESEATLLRYAGTPAETDAPENVASLRLWTKIDGETCVLDLTDLPSRATPLANVPAGFERAEWFGTGTLTVKGGKTFVMNSFASGIGLALEGDGTAVVFPENAQFHDNAKRTATENVSPRHDQYKTIPDLLPDLSLKAFTAKGRNIRVVSENATNMLSVAEVTAATGGEFANDTLAFPGGLSVVNLTFAENSVVSGNGAAKTLDVAGSIALPSSALYSAKGANGAAFVAFRAGGSLTGGETVWTRIKSGPKPVVDEVAKEIRFIPIGIVISIR